jgi:hypothetical protein
MFKIPQFISKFKTDLKTRKAKKNLFKIYLDLDFQFYSVDFDELVAVNYVYKENELYDQSIAGITTFLKFQHPNQKGYEFYPDIKYSQLKNNQKYAVLSYKFSGAYSTRAVALVQSQRLDKIEILEHSKEFKKESLNFNTIIMRILLFLLSYVILLRLLFIPKDIFYLELYKLLGDELLLVTYYILPIFPSFIISSYLNKKFQMTNIYKTTNLEVLTGGIEVVIPTCLSFFLFEYIDKIESDGYGYSHNISDDIPYIFSGLFFAILFLEWIRRYKSEKDKYAVFRYIYIIVMVIAFMLSIKYIELMFEPNL